MSQTQVSDIDPQAAWELLRRRPEAVLVDVRSRVEFDYVGHPIGAVHIAWKEFPDWQVNPAFVAELRRALVRAGRGAPEQVPVLTICRSGVRSREAAEALAQQGFKELYNVAEGFEGERDGERHRGTVNGWRCRGLPWEQT